jgi:uncharacterized protein (DUF342 family)
MSTASDHLPHPQLHPQLQPGYELQLSPDQRTLTLQISAGAKVSAQQIIDELRGMKLARFDDGQVVSALEAAAKAPASVVVASGTAPVDERPERIEYGVPIADGQALIISKVEAGQSVATYTPAVPGTDGIDVFGKPIPHRKSQSPLKIGRNLVSSKGVITATARGNLRLHGEELSVQPLMELRGDEASPPITFDGDVMVKGSLSDGRVLKMSGLLTVGGAIEAAMLNVGASINVKGGIIGKNKGRIDAAGDLRCRFVSGAHIIAGANVLVQSEISNSHIVCAGRLTVAMGAIVGGVVLSNGGISCDVLGHPSAPLTCVEAGDGIVCRTALTAAHATIVANKRRVEEVRAKIAPLLKSIKLLTPQQREKATELLYEADELDAQTRKMEEEAQALTHRLEQSACAEILVAKAVHPGVKVGFCGVETLIGAALRGPLRLSAHKLGTVTEILLTDCGDKSTTVLPSRQVDPAQAAKHVTQWTRCAA